MSYSSLNPQAQIHVIGGGLAGSEAAWQLARRGLAVTLHEMRPQRLTKAHQSGYMAELVCSNSFRSDDPMHNAVGLLHEEMRRCGSLILNAADQNRLPAGGALAVDREGFAKAVTSVIESHPAITICRKEVTSLDFGPDARVIVATGPLTSDRLANAIQDLTQENTLAFFDAIAPIVHRDSIDMDQAWMQSRYDKGDGKDYINCALSQAEYHVFIDALLRAEKTEFREWERNTPYFEGCLPIEVMAERGLETLRFGPMKPVGLTNPHRVERPYAVVQLRQDNRLGTLYNIVGFQTKLKYSEQLRVFRMIPGLEKAEFARLGGLHRNTFLNSPRLLDCTLRLRTHQKIRFAGQITGVEGYVESAAMGLLAGYFAAAEAQFQPPAPPPPTTAIGALLQHITGGADADSFQPMNINFGLFPPFAAGHAFTKRRDRKPALAARALEDLADWLQAALIAA